VVLATIICERDDSAGEANTDTVPRFCFKERDHGSGVEIIDLASNPEEQPLLLGRYSLALSTPLGIYSLALSTLLGSVYSETTAWGRYSSESLLGIEESNALISSAGIRYQLRLLGENIRDHRLGTLRKCPEGTCSE